eukprot:SAG11_NODE_5384_length_1576_cov_1.643873_2_plen_194_part_00
MAGIHIDGSDPAPWVGLDPSSLPAAAIDSRVRQRVKDWLGTRCEDVDAVFERLDLDGDGLVSREELQVLSDSGEVDASTVAGIIAMADTDGDGFVSLAEFKELGRALQDVAALREELGLTSANTAVEPELCFPVVGISNIMPGGFTWMTGHPLPQLLQVCTATITPTAAFFCFVFNHNWSRFTSQYQKCGQWY